jgi:hypothetical protein
LAERFCATGAQVVVNFFSGKHEQQTLSHRHGATTLSAVKRRSAEVLELSHLIPHGKVGFLREEVILGFVHNMRNDRIQDDDRRFGGVDVHDEAAAIVV